MLGLHSRLRLHSSQRPDSWPPIPPGQVPNHRLVAARVPVVSHQQPVDFPCLARSPFAGEPPVAQALLDPQSPTPPPRICTAPWAAHPVRPAPEPRISSGGTGAPPPSHPAASPAVALTCLGLSSLTPQAGFTGLKLVWRRLTVPGPSVRYSFCSGLLKLRALPIPSTVARTWSAASCSLGWTTSSALLRFAIPSSTSGSRAT